MCRRAEMVLGILGRKESEMKLLDEWTKEINNDLAPMWRMSKKTVGTVFYILNKQGKCCVDRVIKCGHIYYDVKV